MEKAISAADANRKFSQVLREVRQGQSYVVTSHGRAVARIAPVEGDRTTAMDARSLLLNRLRSLTNGCRPAEAGARCPKRGRCSGQPASYQQHEHELVEEQPEPQHDDAPGSGRKPPRVALARTPWRPDRCSRNALTLILIAFLPIRPPCTG